MRVLLLTQWYPPEPVSILAELAESLQDAGHNVTVLTGFPNYPSGRIYPGYKQRWYFKERLGRIDVIRVPLYADHGTSALKRILNYISFALSAALIGVWVIPRVDVIHVYHPPLTIGLPAILLSRIFRVPFTYEIQDMWPETLRATGMLNNERVLRLVGWVAKRIYDRAARIRVISQGFRDNLIAKGVAPEKISVISNWVDVDHYRPVPRDERRAEELGFAGRIDIMFAGTIGLAQDLASVLEAARKLQDLPMVQFVIVGDGVDLPRLQQMAQQNGLTNVRFLGRRPADEMPSLYALADGLLIHLRNDPLFNITIPHKLFSYMASAKPVLAAIGGEAAKIVAEGRAGLSCAPGDPEAIERMIRQFCELNESERSRMGENGRRLACDRYGRQTTTQRISDMLVEAVSKPRLARATVARGAWAKRLFDIVVASVMLVLLSPLLLLIALAVWITMGSPILFRQRRPGLHHQIFTLYKFRTMRTADRNGVPLPDSQRMTRLGHWLRASSLDELPELINVIRGDMSLVGPRPLLPEYLDLYTPEQKRRHDVRPGITGWAQVNGRNAISWERKFELDVWYVDHRTFWLDIKILILTVWHVFSRKDISHPDHATMPVFQGSQAIGERT